MTGPDPARARPWARAAGLTGTAADVLLLASGAVQAGRRRVLRVARADRPDDLVGSVGTALTVPAVSPTGGPAGWG
ncbi:hypothetical protein JD79_02854 [Geodermatophilus normandii]|uniref:Uncharacterized protein n=1 Tax=Geodermatophilus normandii TaxID=1137989 RepID=A0A317QKY9_9ACTN|nr:hypothetical protein [Geodermatophilus normandii]PWW23679.1 hypothetical protein JD79_02854 [Geodermatophilus normandii]